MNESNKKQKKIYDKIIKPIVVNHIITEKCQKRTAIKIWVLYDSLVAKVWSRKTNRDVSVNFTSAKCGEYIFKTKNQLLDICPLLHDTNIDRGRREVQSLLQEMQDIGIITVGYLANDRVSVFLPHITLMKGVEHIHAQYVRDFFTSEQLSKPITHFTFSEEQEKLIEQQTPVVEEDHEQTENDKLNELLAESEEQEEVVEVKQTVKTPITLKPAKQSIEPKEYKRNDSIYFNSDLVGKQKPVVQNIVKPEDGPKILLEEIKKREPFRAEKVQVEQTQEENIDELVASLKSDDNSEHIIGDKKHQCLTRLRKIKNNEQSQENNDDIV